METAKTFRQEVEAHVARLQQALEMNDDEIMFTLTLMGDMIFTRIINTEVKRQIESTGFVMPFLQRHASSTATGEKPSTAEPSVSAEQQK